MGCHALLQGIFPAQGSNPHLSRLALAGRLFTTSAPGEALLLDGVRPRPFPLLLRPILLPLLLSNLTPGEGFPAAGGPWSTLGSRDEGVGTGGDREHTCLPLQDHCCPPGPCGWRIRLALQKNTVLVVTFEIIENRGKKSYNNLIEEPTQPTLWFPCVRWAGRRAGG